MRYSVGHKERTRQRVLAEASRVIRAEGPHSVGVAEIMKRVGLTHGGFYAHFGSRELMLTQAIDFMFVEAASVSVAWSSGKTPEEALANYICAYASIAHRDNRAFGCPIPALGSSLAQLGEDPRARFSEGLLSSRARLGALLDAAGRPSIESTSVLSELAGAVMLSRMMTDMSQSEEILAETRKNLLRRLALGDAQTQNCRVR